MDLSVIKDQLGDFKTFIDTINDLLKDLPESLRHLAGLVDQKVDLFNSTKAYEESLKAVARPDEVVTKK